jgi:hypothetical protein
LLTYSIRGIGIEADAVGIGIPASSISVRYFSILVLDCGTLIPVPDSPAFRHNKNCKKVLKVAQLGYNISHRVLVAQ